jgi:hypothetical protein
MVQSLGQNQLLLFGLFLQEIGSGNAILMDILKLPILLVVTIPPEKGFLLVSCNIPQLVIISGAL